MLAVYDNFYIGKNASGGNIVSSGILFSGYLIYSNKKGN